MTKEQLQRVEDPKRLEALAASELMDSPAEETFDRLTRLASRVLSAPVTLVSLVDDHRQFFKSSCGLGEPWCSVRETGHSHSFCQHVVGRDEALVVKDARLHPLLKNNLAITELGAIAYAGFPLRTPEGHVLGSFCAIDTKPREWTDIELDNLRDLTESAATEIALRQEIRSAKKLEKALVLARDEALCANESKSQFLASISHELRTPLNSIIGFTQLAFSSESVQSHPKHRRYLDNALTSSNHLLALINELLDLSQIEAEKLEISLRRVQVASVLKLAVTQVQAEAEKKSLALTVRDDDQNLCASADPRRLNQILLNLLSNAVKFTENGSIEVLAEPQGDNIRIAIRDTGRGLKDQEKNKIFEPFERLAPNIPGTGLGLTISRKIAELMKGTLTAESPGKDLGTTFFLTLPKAD